MCARGFTHEAQKSIQIRKAQRRDIKLKHRPFGKTDTRQRFTADSYACSGAGSPAPDSARGVPPSGRPPTPAYARETVIEHDNPGAFGPCSVSARDTGAQPRRPRIARVMGFRLATRNGKLKGVEFRESTTEPPRALRADAGSPADCIQLFGRTASPARLWWNNRNEIA